MPPGVARRSGPRRGERGGEVDDVVVVREVLGTAQDDLAPYLEEPGRSGPSGPERAAGPGRAADPLIRAGGRYETSARTCSTTPALARRIWARHSSKSDCSP